MRLATWNVNSIRAREGRLLEWLRAQEPDVVCLQEIKVESEAFPSLALAAEGYKVAVHGQRTYNGVAILARGELRDVAHGLWDEDPQARLITATLDGVRVVSAYVPNGGVVGSDKWDYKLEWMRQMRGYLERLDPKQPLALVGDFNVAPEARDVHDPAAWEGSVLFHPDARAALAAWREWGLVDAFRLMNDAAGLYSWWDYRQLAFPRNHGLRIDHIYVTEPLAKRCSAATIDRDQRKGKQPSDHAPVVAEFAP